MEIYLMNVMNWLAQADRELFTFIHSTASSVYLDWPMKLLRNAFTWIPLYAFILYWIIRYQRSYAWKFIVVTLVVFAITDFTSASVLKPLLARPRPCYDAALQPIIRNLVGCAGKYGMPSSHASNHFGMSAFWFFTISRITNRKWWWLWIWALAVCYAQVYVGKHYPGDVIVGGLLGTLTGWIFAMLSKKWMEKKNMTGNALRLF